MAPRKRPKQLALRGMGVSREVLSRREYARRRGVSEAAVRRALKDGRISLDASGKIDPVLADRQWFASTDQSKPRNSVTGDPKHERGAGEPETPMGMGSLLGTRDPETEKALRSFAAARAAREQIKAQIELKTLERMNGRLVDVDKVRAAAFAHTRTARDLLLAIPDRLAAVLAGMTDAADVHRALSEEIRRACAELARPIVAEPVRGRAPAQEPPKP